MSSNVMLVAGSARNIPLADESVQCVVTSPPYWGLRKYEGEQNLVWGGQSDCDHQWGKDRIIKQTPQRDHDGSNFGSTRGTESARIGMSFEASQGQFCMCGAWRGAFGLEPTVEMYVAHSIGILREIRRVLRKDGVVFWNIGDSYNGQKIGNTETNKYAPAVRSDFTKPLQKGSLKPKDLCLIPFRVALAAQADGWWVRSDIIWSKPNPMPESVKDRPTDAYEHILMFTKSAKYYWDKEAVKEPTSSNSTFAPRPINACPSGQSDGVNNKIILRGLGCGSRGDASGRNIRNVWTFPTQPMRWPKDSAHFATFPEELPRRCIKAASKLGDIIFDPFAGSGTVGKVALELGRRAVLLDIAYTSKDSNTKGPYAILALDRISKACPSLEELAGF